MICKEPSLLAPIAEWRAYLNRVESLGDEFLVSLARRTIALKEEMEKSSSPEGSER